MYAPLTVSFRDLPPLLLASLVIERIIALDQNEVVHLAQRRLYRSRLVGDAGVCGGVDHNPDATASRISLG